MHHHFTQIADKTVWFIQGDDESWFASCTCTVLNAAVEIPLTADQAKELMSGIRCGPKRLIQDILPETHPKLRELFITGLTPAEWDQAIFGRPRRKETYRKLGYKFQG